MDLSHANPSSPLSSIPSGFSSESSDSSSSTPCPRSPRASTSPPNPKRRKERHRKSDRERPTGDAEKLRTIHDLIKKKRWSMTDLLRAYAREGMRESRQPGDKQYRIFWLQFKRYAYREALQEDSEAKLDKQEWKRLADSGGIDNLVHIMRQELRKLGEMPSTSSFKYPKAGESLNHGSLDFLDDLGGDIQDKAPRLARLLTTLARPSHKHSKDPQPFGSHQIMWVIMLLFTMQRGKCNVVPRVIGMYLVNSGVKKRVLDLLHKTGLCVSYTSIQDSLRKLANVGEEQVRYLGANPKRVDAYDNYDFAEKRSGERLDQKQRFISLTNGIQFTGQDIPEGGLRQDMWKRHIGLETGGILKKIGDPGLFYQDRGLNPGEAFTRMPVLEEVKIGPTKYHPFAPVWTSEATNDGNITIQRNYEEIQCRLDPTHPRWATILKPTFGDLKTVQRILSVQDIRCSTAQGHYDRKEWMVAGLGLWHLRFNMLKLIHRIHWGGSDSLDASTLQFAADAWTRSNVNTAKDFNKLQDLCQHSYHARIVGLILHLASKKCRTKSEFANWIKGQSSAQLKRTLDRVVQSTNPKDFDAMEQDPPVNEIWYNHQCFIRHMNVYFILTHAIKFADIGLLRQALREACIIFQAPEGQTTNYGPELLRLMHLYDSEAAHPDLQRAMLVNSLVNLRGTRGKTFEVDRLVEFLNAAVAIARKDRTNSTKTTHDLLREITLVVPYMLEVKRKVDDLWGRPRSGEHPEKDAAEDIWTMAYDLKERDFTRLEEEAFSCHLATNLIRSGYACLGDNVYKYNERATAGIGSDDIPANQDDPINAQGYPSDSVAEVMEHFLHITD
ncbi:MAG: hypothetical protein Q9172_001712 [Xanthocarpia lactea]